jgi:hypothetical protein
MGKIEMFDRKTVKVMREYLDKKLAELGQEMGISLKTAGTLSFSDFECKVRLEAQIATTEAAESITKKDKNSLKLMLEVNGFKPELADKPFKVGWMKQTLRLVRYDGKKKLYPFIAEDILDSSKSYKLGPEHLRMAKIV